MKKDHKKRQSISSILDSMKKGMFQSIAFFLTLTILGTGAVLAFNYINKDDKVTQNEWDELVDHLVPSGAVIAFSGTTCPTTWTRYSAADDRVLLPSASGFGSTGGSSSVGLNVNNLPDHTHWYRDTMFAEYKNKVNNGTSNPEPVLDYQVPRVGWMGSGKSDSDNALYVIYRKTGGDLYGGGNSHSSVEGDNHVLNDEHTNSSNNPKQNVDIMNPYIKTIFCEKD